MPINYPSGNDIFTVPSDPADTPLSSAGDGTRNLVESIQDIGGATTALEILAAVKTHAHAGSTDGTHQLLQANTHVNADTDVSPTSIHHTLGTSGDQAAPGNHLHDYNDLVDRPLVICTSTTRPTSPFLGQMIWEVDKNRFRIWSQFSGSDVAQVGLVATIPFNQTNTLSLGTGWNQVYYPIDATLNPVGTAGGLMAVPDGANAQWVFDYAPYGAGGKDLVWPPTGWPWPYVQGRCRAQRTNTVDRHTLTDDQSLTWVAGPTVMPGDNAWPPNPSANDCYLRMSDDGQSYIRVSYSFVPGIVLRFWVLTIQLGYPFYPPTETVMVYYTTSGIENEQLLGTVQVPNFDPWSTYQVDISGRTLLFYNDSNYIGRITDTQNVTAMGSNNRGWGIGMTVGRDPSWADTVACHPTLVHSVTIRDIVYYTGSPVWQILPVGLVPIVRLQQTIPQTLDHAGSIIEWNTAVEDNFGFFNKAASTTDLVVADGCAGLYDVEATLQMGTDFYPDSGTVVFLLNGLATDVRQQASTPGYGSGSKGQNTKGGAQSITVPVSGKLRLADGDVLQVQVYYTSAQSEWDQIVSYSDPAANIVSTLKIKFLSP
jgi:hypothetical protein